MKIQQNLYSYLFFMIIIFLNSNRVHLSKQEIFSNSTMIVKHRMKRQLIFQPGTRIMVRMLLSHTPISMLKKNQAKFSSLARHIIV